MSDMFRIVDNSAKFIAEFERKKQIGLQLVGEKAINHAKVPVAKGGDMPVDTGRLRNSIDHKAVGNDVYIGTNVEYAPYQEYKHHFLKNAAANHSAEYKEIFKKSMQN